MIQVSQFYMITDLSVKCLDFLQQSICVDKAMLVLHIAHKFGLKDVVTSSSLLYIDKYSRDVLQMTCFFQYPLDLVNLMLK